MYTCLRYRFLISLTGSFLLLSIGWTSNLMALELADLPLTKATPEAQNLSSSQLNEAVTKITNGDYGDIDSLLVIRNNYLVLEKYFSPEYYGREYRYPIKSATKSITSALIGIAIDQGKLKGVQTNLLEFFPEYKNIENLDPRKQKITLDNVLSMTAGFQWNESSISYADPRNDSNRMARSPDWIKFVLDSPMSHSPGDSLVYNSGCSLLLSSILEKSTGQSTEEFAIDHLFKPLGIEKWSWSIVPNGLTNTGWGLSLTRLDMARFGILFLNDGRWLDRQVISQKWRQISTSEHVRGKPGEIWPNAAYGYQWWRLQDHHPAVSKLAINDVYTAWGDGGQIIFIIPHLNMVVVSTGNNTGADESIVLDVLSDHIFPAVLD